MNLTRWIWWDESNKRILWPFGAICTHMQISYVGNGTVSYVCSIDKINWSFCYLVSHWGFFTRNYCEFNWHRWRMGAKYWRLFVFITRPSFLSWNCILYYIFIFFNRELIIVPYRPGTFITTFTRYCSRVMFVTFTSICPKCGRPSQGRCSMQIFE